MPNFASIHPKYTVLTTGLLIAVFRNHLCSFTGFFITYCHFNFLSALVTSGAGAHSSSFEPGHIKQIRNKAYFFLAPTRAAQRIREAVAVNVLQVAFFDGDNIAVAPDIFRRALFAFGWYSHFYAAHAVITINIIHVQFFHFLNLLSI